MSWAYFRLSSSSYAFISNISFTGDTGTITAPLPLNKDARRKGFATFRGYDSVIFPMPPRPVTRWQDETRQAWNAEETDELADRCICFCLPISFHNFSFVFETCSFVLCEDGSCLWVTTATDVEFKCFTDVADTPAASSNDGLFSRSD